MASDDQLERLWKEAVMVLLNALSWHLPGETKKIHQNLNQNIRF
jgi:hypothetical protein